MHVLDACYYYVHVLCFPNQRRQRGEASRRSETALGPTVGLEGARGREAVLLLDTKAV